jgi:hypothetical protein
MRRVVSGGLLIATTQVAEADTPPAALVCLARYYSLAPLLQEGRWFGQLPDGTRLPFDDQQSKSFAQKFDHPDLEDVFSIPYPLGPIAPITEVDFDPGRIRLDALFKQTYGVSASRVDLVTIDFLGQRLRVHRKVQAPFLRVAGRLTEALARDPSLRPFFIGLGGTFVWRNIAGTTRPSSHSFGVSLDLNPQLSHYWRWSKRFLWQNRVPQVIVDAFEAEGFIWGGRWYHYDTMHFEYRPELLDPSCTARGNPK